jgi:hypothetical protein
MPVTICTARSQRLRTSCTKGFTALGSGGHGTDLVDRWQGTAAQAAAAHPTGPPPGVRAPTAGQVPAFPTCGPLAVGRELTAVATDRRRTPTRDGASVPLPPTFVFTEGRALGWIPGGRGQEGPEAWSPPVRCVDEPEKGFEQHDIPLFGSDPASFEEAIPAAVLIDSLRTVSRTSFDAASEFWREGSPLGEHQ